MRPGDAEQEQKRLNWKSANVDLKQMSFVPLHSPVQSNSCDRLKNLSDSYSNMKQSSFILFYQRAIIWFDCSKITNEFLHV